MRDNYRYIKGNPTQTLVEGNVFQAERTADAETVEKAFKLLCVGDNEGFDKTLREFILDFGQHEFEFERYFDLGLAAHSLTSLKVLPDVEVD